MDLRQMGGNPPGTLVAASIENLLRSAYQEGDLDAWCQIVVGQNEKLPKQSVSLPKKTGRWMS